MVAGGEDGVSEDGAAESGAAIGSRLLRRRWRTRWASRRKLLARDPRAREAIVRRGCAWTATLLPLLANVSLARPTLGHPS